MKNETTHKNTAAFFVHCFTIGHPENKAKKITQVQIQIQENSKYGNFG
jgi:hypothetical protein